MLNDIDAMGDGISNGRNASKSGGGGGGEVDAYVGSLISLVSRSDIRYEGFLYQLNSHDSTIALSHGIQICLYF